MPDVWGAISTDQDWQRMARVLAEVQAERQRQIAKFGDCDHPIPMPVRKAQTRSGWEAWSPFPEPQQSLASDSEEPPMTCPATTDAVPCELDEGHEGLHWSDFGGSDGPATWGDSVADEGSPLVVWPGGVDVTR